MGLRLGRFTMRGATDQIGNVKDQGDRPVTQDGGGGDAPDAAVVGLQRLDDDLLLAQQIIDEQPDASPGSFHDHHQPFMQDARPRDQPKNLYRRTTGRYSLRKPNTSRPSTIVVTWLGVRRSD